MALSQQRWTTVTPSEFPWEIEALDYIRANLPDQEPYRAWSNFEFIADDGSINEVDLLIVTPMGFYLVEIKSRPGRLEGDGHTWIWRGNNGKIRTTDNPLLLANRKAKKLVSLILKQRAIKLAAVRPFLEPLIFCSAPALENYLSAIGRTKVCFRDSGPAGAGAGILDALQNGRYAGSPRNQHPIDVITSNAISSAIRSIGITQSHKAQKLGDYKLEKLIYESPTHKFQDWEAVHSQFDSQRRRIRIYNIAQSTSQDERDSIIRAANREYLLMSQIDHPNILRVYDATNHKQGPAIIFQHIPEAMRLDHYLAANNSKLSMSDRLTLIRRIAETLKFAHEKKFSHRTLSPQSILMASPESSSSDIRIFNWHTGFKRPTEGGGVSPTSDIEGMVEDISSVYLAPESDYKTDDSGEMVDIFSLGCIAYNILSGFAPADSRADLIDQIQKNKGLKLSIVSSGISDSLDQLIQNSTHPDRIMRYNSVDEFLTALDEVEKVNSKSEANIVENPLNAGVGDRMDGGYEVKRRLGKGGTATAFEVEKDDRLMILKLANNTDHNDRLITEAKTIQKLSFRNIVKYIETVEISGYAGFLMVRVVPDEKQPVQTLADRLKKDGPLTVEFLLRFGCDLLNAVNYLETEGVAHKDIKPDNIAIGRSSNDKGLQLVLFDFSLSHTPAEKLGAGTIEYIDPGLPERQRWDLHAERYSTAVTLYEMATGHRPKWGDGQSSPAVLDCEVTLDIRLPESDLRQALEKFFTKTFKRKAGERFDNALDMLVAWKAAFSGIDESEISLTEDGEFDAEAALYSVELTDEISAIGLNVRLIDGLQRFGVAVVSDIGKILTYRLFRTSGIGNRTKREIAALLDAFRDRFDSNDSGQASVIADDVEAQGGDGSAGIDRIAHLIIESIQRHKNQSEKDIARVIFGLNDAFNVSQDSIKWPTIQETAHRLNIKRDAIQKSLQTIVKKLAKIPVVKNLCGTVSKQLEISDGVMTLGELNQSVLDINGSMEVGSRRLESAAFVLRVATEVERISNPRRFLDRRLSTSSILIAENEEATIYVELLGQTANDAVSIEPVPNNIRLIQKLRSVRLPDVIKPMSDFRLFKLAVAASSKASLAGGGRGIYCRGMSALDSLIYAQNSFSGTSELTINDIIERVSDRYPEAKQLPDRPELDGLLEKADLPYVWNPDAARGKGAYVFTSPFSSNANSTVTQLPEFTKAEGLGAKLSQEEADMRILDDRLRIAANKGAFLLLTTKPKYLNDAKSKLVEAFNLEIRNLDEIFIRVMKVQAQAHGVDWNVVLNADASRRDGSDWRNLMNLVDISMPAVEQELCGKDRTLLLVNPGLLARYDKMNLLERLRDRTNTRGGNLHGLWVLMPADEQSSMPLLDGKAVPVMSNSQWANITPSWIVHK